MDWGALTRSRIVAAGVGAMLSSCGGETTLGKNFVSLGETDGGAGASTGGVAGSGSNPQGDAGGLGGLVGEGGEGGDRDPASCGVPAKNGAMMPLVVGASWTYSVYEKPMSLQLPPKTSIVIEEPSPNTFKIHNTGERPAVRWLEDTGSAYVWVRNLYAEGGDASTPSDQYYEPPALRFDYSRMEPGDTWELSYEKAVITIDLCPDWEEGRGRGNLDVCPPESIERQTIVETWTVTDDRRAVSVPAGDFVAICQRRTCPDEACIEGEYCFARGVGKVWEDSDQHEELVDFCLPMSATR